MDKITFGRLQDNDIVFNNDSVSRHHGYLLIDGSKAYVVDNDSLNGIFVNGRRIQKKELLSPGDTVLIANMVKLDWQKYCRIDAAATVRNDQIRYTPSEPKPANNTEKQRPKWVNTFLSTAGKIIITLITTIITMVAMAWVTSMFR